MRNQPVPPAVAALYDRIFAKYSLDGETVPVELVERMYKEFREGLKALGFAKVD